VRQMRRVLARGGRVLISVPSPTEFFDKLETALARHHPPASGFVRQVFSLHDPETLRAMLWDAGFSEVVVRIDAKTLDLPPARDFVWQYIHCTPLAALIAADERVMRSLEQEMETAWQPWVHGNHMRYEQGMLVVTARRT